MNKQMVKDIDAILPQTQCGQCGYAGCEPYAEAIVEGLADINQCPPGDAEGIQKLADLLGIKPKLLNTTHGLPKTKAVALIDEDICIGCTFCIKACPVDAIVGAAKQMHTVITAECTGCELCIEPCPMDCISMLPVKEQSATLQENKLKAADQARSRYQFRLQRLEREKQAEQERLVLKNGAKSHMVKTPVSADDRKKMIVQAAIKRANAARVQMDENNNTQKPI